MESDRRYYWVAQLTSWLLWSGFLGVYNHFVSEYAIYETIALIFLLTLIGIVLTHFYRWFMVKDGWLSLPLIQIIPRAIIGSVLLGMVYTLILGSILDLFFKAPEDVAVMSPPYDLLFQLLVSKVLIFLLWSAAYFVYNYVRNYERQEIRNLKLEASRNTMELNVLRAQLNPHFMFNAMNSIRALIEEDPQLARTAVTRLSNLLRNTLIAGKKELVSLDEELKIVKDLVALEKIRYEERLNSEFIVDESTLSWQVPPLILQTLVENAIKHGVSKLPGGGDLHVIAKRNGAGLKIIVENSGHLNLSNGSDTGIGLENTRRRLNLIYGNRALFTIENIADNRVRSTVTLPEINRI